MIQLEVISKTYRNIRDGSVLTVLRGLEFSIEKSQFCSIVGPSGCGKTTLLNIISGLDRDIKGWVKIDGVEPGAGPPPGYMFQSSRLMPWLTVRENLELVLDRDSRAASIDDLAKEIDLQDFVDAYPGQLSGGMRRRVALARTMINEPSLLLLDEPFLSLDAPVANRLRRLLTDACARRSATVLFVTHDLREALYLADRVLFVSDRPGRIVLDQMVEMPRPRVADGEAIEMLRLDLLRRHPQILSGLAANADSLGDQA